jgi:hypothetical protein
MDKPRSHWSGENIAVGDPRELEAISRPDYQSGHGSRFEGTLQTYLKHYNALR